MSRPMPFDARRGLALVAGLAILTVIGRLGRTGHHAVGVAQAVASPPDAAPGRGEAAGRAEVRRGQASGPHHGDRAPGERRTGEESVAASIRTYLIGLALAGLLTAGSFALSYTGLIYGPGVPVALVVFAIAQIGVHLVFFLHLTTSPDNVNNALALAFGTLIVVLVIGGTLWIMWHMNANMMPMGGMPHAR